MERYNLKYYLEKVFNKLLDDEGTRCRVLGLNSIDFDIQIDGDSVPYIKAMRGTLVFGTKSYINKDKIYEYVLTFPEYLIGNLEIDIDIGFIYNYYPLYALKYNI